MSRSRLTHRLATVLLSGLAVFAAAGPVGAVPVHLGGQVEDCWCDGDASLCYPPGCWEDKGVEG